MANGDDLSLVSIYKMLDDRERSSADIEKSDRGSGPHGLAAALLDHLHDALGKREQHGFSKSERENSTMDSFEKMVADRGIIAVAKAFVDEGRSFGISEEEFTKLATEDASRRWPDMRPDSAFSKLFSDTGPDSLALRKAHAVIRASLTEQMLSPTLTAKTADGEGKAYNELMVKAEEYRSANPQLSIAQAFEKIYTSSANIELAKRERQEAAR